MKSRSFPARYAILKYRKNAEDTSLSQNYSFTGNYFFITVTIVIWLLVRLLCKILKTNRLLVEKLNGQSGTWTFSFVINVILSRIDIRKLYWHVTYLCIRVVLARRWHSVEHKSSCCGGRIWRIGCERWKSWQSRFTVLQKWSFKRLQKKTKKIMLDKRSTITLEFTRRAWSRPFVGILKWINSPFSERLWIYEYHIFELRINKREWERSSQ